MLILPPKFKSKIGSKEPKNRQKLISTTDSYPAKKKALSYLRKLSLPVILQRLLTNSYDFFEGEFYEN